MQLTAAAISSKIAPGSWWLLALSLMVMAGASADLVTPLVVSVVSLGAVLLFRQDVPWAHSLRFYVFLALLVVVIRVVFRMVFNIPDSSDLTLISLPQITFNLGFGPEVQLFGNIGQRTLMLGLIDGLRLAAIILSVAMASTLANPRKLLKSTPGVLYEVASAISVAINLAPQLISSLQRVRKARELRGRTKGLGQLAGIVIPVLEDAIDSSVSLAASMDSRGFGRRGEMSRVQLIAVRSLSLSSVTLLAIGSFLLLSGGMPSIAIILIAVGMFALFLAIRIGSQSNLRTRYQPTKFSLIDWGMLLIALTLILFSLNGWFQ